MMYAFNDVLEICLRSKGKVVSEIEKKQLLNELRETEGDRHEVAVKSVGNILGSAVYGGLYYQFYKFLFTGLDYGIDIEAITNYLDENKPDLVKDALALYEIFKKQLEEELIKGQGAITQYSIAFNFDVFNKFLLKHILKKDIDLANLCCDDIDEIVNGLDKDMVSGVLYTFAYNAYQNGNDEVFYYIYSEYVFPSLTDEDWLDQTRLIECKKGLLKQYILLLYKKIIGISDIFWEFNFDNSFWDKVVKDLINKKDDINIITAKEILRYTRDFGDKMLGLFESSTDCMKLVLDNNLYSFFASITTFMLQADKRDLKAIDMLIDHYEDINTGASPYKIIMLAKAIWASSQFNEKNILYGYYLRDQTDYYRKSDMINSFINDFTTLFDKIYQFISNTEKDSNYYVKEYLKNTVFEEWGLYDFSQDFSQLFYKADDSEKISSYNDLIDILRAFNDIECIDIEAIFHKMKSINNINAISLGPSHIMAGKKIDNILPMDLQSKIRKLNVELSNTKASVNSLKRRRFFDTLDLVLKDMISDSLKEEINSIMKRIGYLREGFSEDLDGEFTKLWNILAPTYEKIKSKYTDRNEIIKFYLELDKGYNCWNKLDDECKNMLITAEIVYRTLANREDAEELDYSASMIPLTKVLENILNKVFNRIKYNINFDKDFITKDGKDDFESKRYYGYYVKRNNSWKPKDSLELGPAIRVLCDGDIFIQDNNEIEEISKGRSRRELWGINDVIDWTRLSVFAGSRFSCIGFKDFECKYVQQYEISNDLERNRLIFISALEYIKNAYRNKVAHKDGINKNKMEKCRNDMLLAQKLIWILLYIIK